MVLVGGGRRFEIDNGPLSVHIRHEVNNADKRQIQHRDLQLEGSFDGFDVSDPIDFVLDKSVKKPLTARVQLFPGLPLAIAEIEVASLVPLREEELDRISLSAKQMR